MNVIPRCFYFPLAFVLHFTTFAQRPDFSFQKVEGLSQNTVFRITQDKQGFLWLATGDGLNRYDGRAFRAYRPSSNNEPGFITGRVIRSKIIEGSNNTIWLHTESGLQSLNKKSNRFKYHLPFNDTFIYANGSLYPIAEQKDFLWFGKIGTGLISLDIKKNVYSLFPFPVKPTQHDDYFDEDAIFDGNETCWFSRNSGLFSFNIKTKKWNLFLKDTALNLLCHVKESLYIISKKGLTIFNTITHLSRSISFGRQVKHINAITKGPGNSLWLGDSYGNIFKYNPINDSISLIGNINTNTGNVFPIYDLYFDASEILWIGTDGMGLLKANINPPDFFTFPANDEAGGLFVKSIYEDESGKVWLGTFGHGILQLNREKRTIQALASFPFIEQNNKKLIVSFIKQDQYKNTWVGFGDKLYFSENSAELLKAFPLQVENNQHLRITGMFPFRKNIIITTTTGTYFLTPRPNGAGFLVETNHLLSDFSFIHSKNEKEFILGYLEGGLHLYHLNKDGSWAFIKKLVQEIGVKCSYNDTARKLLWLGTDKGLVAYNTNDDKYRIYTEADGLNNSFVYGILESDGELWLSTNGGLSNIKIKKGGAKNFPDIICKNYRTKDGLQSDEFNTNAFLKGRDGTLYFGGIKGVNWFNPKTVAPKKKIQNVVIVNMLVNNLPADTIASEYIRDIVLPYQKNNIYLQFNGLEFSNPESINYVYMLEGWDKTEIYSNVNEARYNNLPPGRYAFKVQASNDNANNQPAERTVYITILPPFWRTWWFYCLVVLLVLAMLYWTFKINTNWRLKKEREKLQQQKDMYNERMRIAREMHDDIGAGLTQISMISASAKLHIPATNKTGSELEAISTTARQLVDNLSEIIWALNPGYNTLDILLSHLREQISKLTEYSKLNCRIDIAEDIPNLNLTNQQRRNILLVTKEIVHNAIKHCGGKNLKIAIMYKNARLHFDIADDGKGFSTEVTHAGNGMKNIKHRIEEIGGVLHMKSSPNAGCSYTYDFPLF